MKLKISFDIDRKSRDLIAQFYNPNAISPAKRWQVEAWISKVVGVEISRMKEREKGRL